MGRNTITAEAVYAMLQYSNITPEIFDELATAIDTLISAFSNDWQSLVGAHVNSYKDLLQECKVLVQTIGTDLDDSSEYMKKRVKTYNEILSKKVR